MLSHAITLPPSSDDQAGPVPIESALIDVLDWVTGGPRTPVEFTGLSGVTEDESAHLARVVALVLPAIDSLPTAAVLTDALAPSRDVDVPRSVLASFNCLLLKDPVSLLAELYARIVAASNRRTLGTFFTPRAEAMSMVNEFASQYSDPSVVVDVGAGVGVFSAAASQRWPASSVLAIDINPVTLGLQAAALSMVGGGNTRLLLRDYGAWITEYAPSGPTLYLGNPPYTRWQLIPAEDRARLREATDGLVGSRANLSTIFLAITLKKLRPCDALSLIVPAGWMSAGYAKHLRAFVRGMVSRPIKLRLADSWRFDGAIVDAVVVEVGPELAGRRPLTIADWPGTIEVELTRGTSDTSPFARLEAAQSHDEEEVGWLLGDFARFSRGVATGANSFFVRSAEAVADTALDQRWWTTVIRRLRLGKSPASPAVETAMLLSLAGYRRGSDSTVDTFLREAEERGVDKGYLCSVRDRWFDLSAELWIPDVVLTSLGRDVFHTYENSPRHVITNNLFGWAWRDSVTREQRSQILRWIRSEDGQDALLKSSVREANGLRRLSPRALAKIGLPAGVLSSDAAKVG